MKLKQDPFDEPFESLEKLADTISETLQCPVTIEDANHRLLAYSFHDLQTDPARIATIIGRRVPEPVINSLWREGVIQKLLNNDEPVRIASIADVGLGNRVAISIRKNHEILGYIWVVEINQLNEHSMHLLKNAAQAAKTKLLQLQIRKQKQEEDHQEFFWRLLTGSFKSDALIKEEAEKLKLTLPAAFQIIVFDFLKEINTNIRQQIQYLIKTNQRIRILFSVTDRNQLILLSTAESEHTVKQDLTTFVIYFIQQMMERFQVCPIEAAVGSLYREQYSYVETSYQEALVVLQIKKQFPNETNHMYHYEDLGFYRYIPLIQEHRKTHRINNPSLKKLFEYDQIHHSTLLETLDVYLSCDSNVKEAADLLHVHTNTLNYRLTRIAEIANINLKDMDQKVSLYLDLKLSKLEHM